MIFSRKDKSKSEPDAKVFGIGWAKTGTTTLGKCFSILGYRHQSQRLDMVKYLQSGNLEPIITLTENSDSFEDWPWILLYQQMNQLYPNSKFVLTKRETSNWLKSYLNMLRNQPSPSPELNQTRSMLYQLPFPNVTSEQLIERYEKHNREVITYFKKQPEKLLVVNWEQGDGWKKLCNFLGKDIPEIDFPHENTGQY